MKKTANFKLEWIKFFIHPEVCPPGWQVAFTLGSIFIYFILVIIFKPIIGWAASGFSALPIITIAWFFGLKIGLIYFFLLSTVNLLIFFILRLFNLEAFNHSNGIISVLLLLATTSFVGKMRDDRKRIYDNLSLRLKIEEDLSLNRARLSSLFENIQDAVIFFNECNMIQEINSAACRMFRLVRSELIGSPLISFVNLGSFVNTFSSSIHSKNQEPLKGETIIFRDDGSSLTVEYIIISSNLQMENILILRDISVARKNELEINQLLTTERENRALAEALSMSAAALNSSLNLDEVLDQIMASVGQVVPHTAVNIMLVEGDKARVVRAHGYEIYNLEEFILTITYPIQEHYNLKYLVREAKPLVISNTHTDPRWFQSEKFDWIGSYAAAPVIIDGEVIGFLNLDSHLENQYIQEHAERLMIFANQAAIAIRNARIYSQIHNEARQNAILNDLTLAAISAPTLHEMAQSLANKLLDIYGAYGTYLTLWDDKKKIPVPTAASGHLKDEYPAISVSRSEFTLTHLVLERGEPIFIPDITSIQGISPTILGFLEHHQTLVLPLIADQKPLGAVIIAFPIGQAVTPQDLGLARRICPKISLAVAKARLLDSEQRQLSDTDRTNQLLSALSRMAAKISTANDLEAIFSTLGDELKSIGVYCLVSLQEQDGTLFSVRYLSSPRSLPDKWKRYMNLFNTFTSDFPLFPMIMKEKQSVFIREPIPLVADLLSPFPEHIVQQIIQIIGFHQGTKAISLPLVTGDEVVGVITLWGDDIRETDQSAALLFASQVAIAIQKAQLFSEIQQMVITDDLTGVYNRRGLFNLGQQEVERARRFDHPLSLLFIDVDYFKNINDQFGHHIGDEVLLHIAGRIRKNIRDLDFIGRYGGDEFLVILVESDLNEAVGIAYRILASLAEEPIQSSTGEISSTLSIGVAELNDLDDGFESLVIRADQLLYLAKESGRNRIISKSQQ